MLFINNNSNVSVYDANTTSDIWLYSEIYSIRTCFLPIVLLGTVTNAFNFSILLRRDMRFLSTSVYLFALAIADTGVMYFELFRIWFEWADLVSPEIYFSSAYCKLANYMNGITRDFSNWLIACLTFERLMMVASPFKAKYLCTVRTAQKVTACLFVVLCVPHIHYLMYSVPVKGRLGWTCWEDKNKPLGVLLSIIIDFMFGYMVILVVFVMNILLIVLICRSKSPYMISGGKGRTNKNRFLTRTLFAVSLMFLICETPRMIIALATRYLERTSTLRILFNITYIISGLNHACNFFIYIIASPRFRLLALKTFPFTACRLRKKRRNTSSPTLHVPSSGKDKLLVKSPNVRCDLQTTRLEQTPPTENMSDSPQDALCRQNRSQISEQK